MPPDRFFHDTPAALTWNDLTVGAPTIIGLAALCSRALAGSLSPPVELSPAARAILFAARARCNIEIKAVKNAYDSSQRLLAVHVELAPERILAFRSRTAPQFTLQMLDGFRELCAAGLTLHHLGHDFSLTHAGVQIAGAISQEEVQPLLDQAVELEFED